MTELLVGSRLPDLSQVIVDVVLRYRMKRFAGFPTTDEATRLKRAADRFERANARFPTPPFVDVQPTQIGATPAEWVSIKDQPATGALLYFHGGGFLMGSPRTHRAVTWRLSRATKRRVLAIEYRKAPEHAFPAWIDDGAAAFRWLVEQGHAPGDILVAGDSAGGNMVLSVTQRLRREGSPLPGGLILFSPWADLACQAKSYRANAFSEAMFTAAAVRASGAYLTRGLDPRDPEASPVHADFKGFPPILLFAGSRELFVDDARLIARRATAAGVRAELHVYRHMPHVFPVLAGMLPRAKAAFGTVERFASELRG